MIRSIVQRSMSARQFSNLLKNTRRSGNRVNFIKLEKIICFEHVAICYDVSVKVKITFFVEEFKFFWHEFFQLAKYRRWTWPRILISIMKLILTRNPKMEKKIRNYTKAWGYSIFLRFRDLIHFIILKVFSDFIDFEI